MNSTTHRVLTAHGYVDGKHESACLVWRGIPYAQPPIGPLRFRSPVALEPWHKARDCSRFSANSLQPTSTAFTSQPGPGFSEDCLYLNIWSPATDSIKRPVLVFIHGGAFVIGGGDYYDGSHLAVTGQMVVVTLNYRLGVFGFVNFADYFADDRFGRNIGLRDQIFALQWLHANIAAFGGDPGRITLAGESAGATSVALLTLTPAAAGLFAGAILQSGAINFVADHDESLEIASTAAQLLNIDRASANRLWQLPAEQLLAAQNHLSQRRPNRFAVLPWLDGDLLPATPEALHSRRSVAMPLLAGTNHDEFTLFAASGAGSIFPSSRADLDNRIRNKLGAAAESLLDAYPKDVAAMLQLGGDFCFTMPVIQFAERHAEHSPVWMYRFDCKTPAFGGGMGAMHALELFYLWKFNAQTLAIYWGAELKDEAWEQKLKLAARMQSHWISFVHNGYPCSDWLPFTTLGSCLDTPSKRVTHIFDIEDRQVSDPEHKRRKLWSGLTPLVQ